MSVTVSERAAEMPVSRAAFIVRSMTLEARDVLLVELVPAGGSVEAFAPGAHIDVLLPNGISRQYSLVNEPAVRDRYMICVKNDPNSRGGSRYMHERLRVGASIDVTAVRNHFALSEHEAPVLLIAGGIGITPIVTMAERLAVDGRPADVIYAVKSRADLAFVTRLERAAAKLTIHVDEEAGTVLDVGAFVRARSPDTHVYCCGPGPMLDAFIAVSEHRPAGSVHFERFGAAVSPAIGGDTFTVELARSGRSLVIGKNESILDALRSAGIHATSSCEEGICGTCEVAVLSGTPDHRDGILNAAERRANRTMMICCSRSIGEHLVLDM